MNESEIRRKELLKQMRQLYNDKKDVPAVHPRYGRIYQNLYEPEHGPTEKHSGSFFIRLVVGIVCFIFYVYLDQSNSQIARFNSNQIVNQIEQETDLKSIINTLSQ